MGLDKENSEKLEYYFHCWYSLLYEYAMRIFHNHHVAEELVQDTFLIACKNMDQIERNDNPKKWFFCTIRNLMRNVYRKDAAINKYRADIPEDDTLIGSTGEEVSFQAMYTDLLGKEDFELLNLVVLHGESIQNAAEQLGISVEACKKRVQRAKIKLRGLLEEIDRIT